MAHRWTTKEENAKRKELEVLYIKQNKTINKVGKILGIAESSVFDRMRRLGIPSIPEKKLNYRNVRHDIKIPDSFSAELAEFVGIMLGDGHISPTQLIVSFNSNEKDYLLYVSQLTQTLFHVSAPKYIKRLHKNACDLYIGSTELVQFFKGMGLVQDKVKEQVDVPSWIQTSPLYQKKFLRGLFDTDGSIYKLRFGIQMNFCNRSFPLLNSTKNILEALKFHPSRISAYKVYLTRNQDLLRYRSEIGFGNMKHLAKAEKFGIIN